MGNNRQSQSPSKQHSPGAEKLIFRTLPNSNNNKITFFSKELHVGSECSIQVVKKKKTLKEQTFPFLLNRLVISQEILPRQHHNHHGYLCY